MGALGLRDTHDAINAVIMSRVSDADKVETAMTKTEEGYVYEIRYKDMKKGWPWRVELPADPVFIGEMAKREAEAIEKGGELGSVPTVSPL